MRMDSKGLKMILEKSVWKNFSKITKTNITNIIFSNMMVRPKLMEGDFTLAHEFDHWKMFEIQPKGFENEFYY